MTGSASLSHLPSEFDDFLYAPIGEERNGMPLSVLSALTRLDLDPWQEASRLARLPGEAATHRLTSQIAELSDGAAVRPNPEAIAARLIALLPRQDSAHIPAHEMARSATATTNARAVMRVILINMILIAVVLGSHWIMGNHPTTGQVDNAHRAPVSSAVSPPVPPLNSGHS
jgi:hypothetical protein